MADLSFVKLLTHINKQETIVVSLRNFQGGQVVAQRVPELGTDQTNQ